METQGNFVAIMTRQRPLLLFAATLILANGAVLAQVPANIYDQAVVHFGRQQYAEAEQILRPALAGHPRDARALALMGLILDEQQRFAEAETFYRRALALAPDSASLGFLGWK